jgi:hypothetical protein
MISHPMYTLLIAIILILIVKAVISAQKDKRIAKHRNNELQKHEHFLGKNILEAIRVIGPASFSQTYSLDDERHVWDSGDALVSLITDRNGKIIDYCPARASWKEVELYFRKNSKRLKSKPVRKIMRSIGRSHSEFGCDFGVTIDIWNGPSKQSIDVWSKNGLCTDIEFSNDSMSKK